MSAIQSTLELVRARLDSFFKVSDPRTEDWVILSNVVDHEGRPYEAAKDKIVVFLAGIQPETVIGTHARTVNLGSSQFGTIPQPVYINLLVLFYANFYDKNYPDALGMISRTIGFFQQTPLFTRDTLPDLDPTIEKISLELVSLDVTQANYLMAMLGAKYLPSVLYRLRMIPFRSDAIAAVVAPARNMRTNE
jgi:hypothetical protein